MIPILSLRDAQSGLSVLVVTNIKSQFSAQVGDGILFVRGFAMSGLKSVSVDRVYLVGDVPEEAALLARECGGDVRCIDV